MARDRKRRETKLPSKYDDFDVEAYALYVASDIETDEPKSYQEAMRSKERETNGVYLVMKRWIHLIETRLGRL